MVKIIDKRTELNTVYKIGDWIYIHDADRAYLCVIAQTENGKGQLIHIGQYDANRMGNSMGDVKFLIHEGDGTHDRLSDLTINRITVNGKHKIEKVNVTIEVTNHNS